MCNRMMTLGFKGLNWYATDYITYTINKHTTIYRSGSHVIACYGHVLIVCAVAVSQSTVSTLVQRDLVTSTSDIIQPDRSSPRAVLVSERFSESTACHKYCMSIEEMPFSPSLVLVYTSDKWSISFAVPIIGNKFASQTFYSAQLCRALSQLLQQICPSVRSSHVGIVSKRINVRWCRLHSWVVH